MWNSLCLSPKTSSFLPSLVLVEVPQAPVTVHHPDRSTPPSKAFSPVALVTMSRPFFSFANFLSDELYLPNPCHSTDFQTRWI